MAVPVPSRMSFFDAATGTFDQAGFDAALAAYQADRGMLTGTPVQQEETSTDELGRTQVDLRPELNASDSYDRASQIFGDQITPELWEAFVFAYNTANENYDAVEGNASSGLALLDPNSRRGGLTRAQIARQNPNASQEEVEQIWRETYSTDIAKAEAYNQRQQAIADLFGALGMNSQGELDTGRFVYRFDPATGGFEEALDRGDAIDRVSGFAKSTITPENIIRVAMAAATAGGSEAANAAASDVIMNIVQSGVRDEATREFENESDAIDVDTLLGIVNSIDQVDADVPEEIGQQQEEAAQETTPVVDIPFDIFIDTTQDEPIFADVETGDVTVGLPDIPIEEEEEGGGGAEATPVVTPTPEVTPEVTPEPTPTPVTPAPVVTPTTPVTPAPEQPQPTAVAPVVTPNVTPAPAPAPQESTNAAQEGTQGELGYERRRVTREDGSLWSVLIDTQTGNEVPESSFILRDANGNIVGDTSDPFEGFYQVDDKGDFVTDETGNRLVDWVLWENTFLPAGYNIQEAAGQEGTQQEEVPQAIQTPVQTQEQTQEPSEDTSSVVGSLLDQYITPVRDQIQQQENAIGNLVNQVANMPVPPTQEEIIGYLRQNGVPLDEATVTNIQNRINEATANQITQEQVDEALVNAGFVKPEDVKTAIEGAGFATPDDIKNAVADAGFATPEDIDDALAGLDLNFATPDEVKNAIATAGFATPDDIDTAVSNAGFATPDDIDTALSNAGFTTPEDVTNALAESGFATTEQLESAIGGLDFAKPSDVVDAIAKSGFATPADIATALTESGFASAEELTDLASAFESSLTGLESAFGTSLEGIRGEFETGLEGLGEGLAGLGEGLEGLGEGLEQGLSEAELGRRQLASRINQREFKPAPIPQLSYQPLQLEGLIQGPQRDYVNELNQIINRSLFEGMI